MCVLLCVCVRVKVHDLQIYTRSQSILWLIKWESNVKLSGFNRGSAVDACVCVCVQACIINAPSHLSSSFSSLEEKKKKRW